MHLFTFDVVPGLCVEEVYQEIGDPVLDLLTNREHIVLIAVLETRLLVRKLQAFYWYSTRQFRDIINASTSHAVRAVQI
jgi:hypothetical protein